MSAHPAAAPKASPQPPVISTTLPAQQTAAGKEIEPTALDAATAGLPLEPHWEPVVSAATD